jgi:hypothetical protein
MVRCIKDFPGCNYWGMHLETRRSRSYNSARVGNMRACPVGRARCVSWRGSMVFERENNNSTSTTRGTAAPTTASTVAARDDARLNTILRHWLQRADADARATLGIQIGERAPTILTQGKPIAPKHIPLRAHASFRIGSVTKAFVGDVALALAKREQLDLDATISRWFADFRHTVRRVDCDVRVRGTSMRWWPMPRPMTSASRLVRARPG